MKNVIAWNSRDGANKLWLDIPKEATQHVLSDGTLRFCVPTPQGEPPLNSLVGLTGVPITKIVSVPYKEKT
jgi:hypothetical protein